MSAAHELADLLAAAREVLRRDIVAALPAEQRYAAAMVANALAIAARGLAGHPASDEAFAPLYREEATALPRATLERRLVADIRAGRFDSHDVGRLQALLLERTVQRLKISDPDALAASGLG